MMNFTKLVGLGWANRRCYEMERVGRSRVPAAFSVICRQSTECVVMG
jgi:hypothetical protein